MSQQATTQVLTKAAEKSCPIINKKTIFGALAVLVAGYAVYRLNKHAAEKRKNAEKPVPLLRTRSRIGSASSCCSRKRPRSLKDPVETIVELKPEPVEENPVVLSGPDKPVSLTIESRTDITSDTAIFRVKLPSEKHVLGYPTGYHIRIYGTDQDGIEIKRPYTPISRVGQTGHVDILIKFYRPQGDFKGGRMSHHLDKLQAGDLMTIDGPVGKHTYLGNGQFSLYQVEEKPTFKELTFIAGGTGITPFYQILQEVRFADEPEKRPKINLIFANRTKSDILLYGELCDLATIGIANITLTVDSVKEGEEWGGHVGYLNKEVLEKLVSKPDPHHGLFFCGPPPMNEFVSKTLAELGHSASNIIKY